MQNLIESEEVVEVYDKDLSTSPSDLSSQDRIPENPAWLFSTQKLSPPEGVVTTETIDTSILWTAYTENVAPLIRIFHHPTMKKLWQEASSGIRTLTAIEETAFGSIYFAASVSLQDSETRHLFNRSKEQVVEVQRRSIEQRFQDNDLLNTGSVMALQAFVLYLIALRRLDDTRLVLSLLGIAVRLAMSLGLQRDGLKFKVDFLDVELRRRVWWRLSLLDFELSNDHGVDPLLRNDASDTSLPSNIDDEDLHLGMAQPPVAKMGFTEMTPSLVRFEIGAIARKLLYTAPGSQRISLQQQKTVIEDLQARLRDRYLNYCSNDHPLQWSTTVVARSKVTMLWVSMYHQLQHVAAAPSPDLNDKMITDVMEIVDDVRDLESNAKSVNWGWYFHNDVQWLATVYLLNELIRRPPDALSDRAWDVLKQARDQWYANAGSKVRLQGMLFKPMRALTNRAFWVREGKQPPYRKPMPDIMESFPEFKVSDDFDFPSLQYPDATHYSPLPFMGNVGGTQSQSDLSGWGHGFAPAPEQMETFMLPLWNQDWQFLAQNAPP